ncbi:interferon-related developmental regulator 2-like [Anopheles moucheti]|uniref:interferon-related developmental regulator 2-like n=1 Tax=Anopheles moucheti TaxID=186751 RepID=UPI0022EFF756|nr:interferon-related developmental regulator 2-like [Anopheles moucheti]
MASDELDLVEKLLQAFEDVSCKRQQTRIKAYDTMREIWMHYYIPNSLVNRKMALMASVERSLKKGQEKELIWAANVIPLLVVQSESIDDVTEIVNLVKPLLMSIVKDCSVVISNARVQCCTVLGLLFFFAEDDPVEIVTLMKMLQEVLQNRNIEHDEDGDLYAKVMNSWSLLLTLLTPESIVKQISDGVLLSASYLVEMLGSTRLSVRTVTGKTLALVYELSVQHDANFLHDELPDLIETIQSLAKDAYRFQAKEDRKLQRSIFRDVLHYLQKDVTPELRIKFADETLLLDSWAINHQYTCLRNMFGSGMNVHLKENLIVRNMLNLGHRMGSTPKYLGKIAKMEQWLSNTVATKNRSIARGKERDKRYETLD